MKDVEIPVRLLFTVPDGFDDMSELRRRVEAAFEWGTVREVMFAATDDMFDGMEVDEEGCGAVAGYAGYAGLDDDEDQETVKG